jgi:hypothetical protein
MESKLWKPLFCWWNVNIDAITGGLTFKMHGQVGILWLMLSKNSINKSL